MDLLPALGSVVVWTELELLPVDDASVRRLMARRYDSSGQPLGPEVAIVSAEDGDGRPGGATVVLNDDGGYTVAWLADPGIGEFSRLRLQRFDMSGTAISPRREIEAGIESDPAVPVLDRAPDGELLLAWLRQSPSFSDRRPSLSRLPVLTALTLSTETLVARRYDASGQPRSGEVEIAKATDVLLGSGGSIDAPFDVALDDDGDFTVAWKQSIEVYNVVPTYPFSLNPNGRLTYDALKLRRFDAAGQPLGRAQIIDSNRSLQLDIGQVELGPRPLALSVPALAVAPDGGIAVAWQRERRIDFDSSVLLRRFDANGVALAEAVEIDPDATSGRTLPPVTVVALDDASLVVGWERNPSGEPSTIVARRVDPAGGIGPRAQVSVPVPGTALRALAASGAGNAVEFTWMADASTPPTFDVVLRRRYQAP